VSDHEEDHADLVDGNDQAMKTRDVHGVSSLTIRPATAMLRVRKRLVVSISVTQQWRIGRLASFEAGLQAVQALIDVLAGNEVVAEHQPLRAWSCYSTSRPRWTLNCLPWLRRGRLAGLNWHPTSTRPPSRRTLGRYTQPTLGEVRITSRGYRLVLDAGSWPRSCEHAQPTGRRERLPAARPAALVLFRGIRDHGELHGWC